MRHLLSAVRGPILNFRFPQNSNSKRKFVTAKFVRLIKGKSGRGVLFNVTQLVQRIVSVLLVFCPQFLVEFFAWRSGDSSRAAGIIPCIVIFQRF
jgi:hypothetical protein